MGTKVRVTAAKQGTFVSPGSGTIHRFNPKSKNEAARKVTVDSDDLIELLKRGLIVDPTAGDAKGEGKAEKVVEAPELTAEDVARARVAATAGIDDAAGPIASGLSTKAANNYDPNSIAGRENAEIDRDPPHVDEGLDAGDPDAPPAAPAKKAPAAKK